MLLRLAVDLVVVPSVSARMITSCRWGPDRVMFFLWLDGPSKHIVQEAIKQLQERGEKVTAFVVIAVAKQVVLVEHIDLGSESDIHTEKIETRL